MYWDSIVYPNYYLKESINGIILFVFTIISMHSRLFSFPWRTCDNVVNSHNKFSSFWGRNQCLFFGSETFLNTIILTVMHSFYIESIVPLFMFNPTSFFSFISTSRFWINSVESYPPFSAIIVGSCLRALA